MDTRESDYQKSVVFYCKVALCREVAIQEAHLLPSTVLLFLGFVEHLNRCDALLNRTPLHRPMPAGCGSMKGDTPERSATGECRHRTDSPEGPRCGARTLLRSSAPQGAPYVCAPSRDCHGGRDRHEFHRARLSAAWP